jgi:hypothetical protein
MAINTKKYIESYLQIRDKQGVRKNLILNEAQSRLYAVLKQQHEQGKPQRVVILKPRQTGMSTFVGGYFFKRTATKHNVNTLVVAHDNESSDRLFNMVKNFYNDLPDALKPETKYSNKKELVFDTQDGKGLRSEYRVGTAGSGEKLGRGSTFDNLHLSEYAFYSGDVAKTMAAVLQAVPNSNNSCVIIESTANGYNHFKDLWDRSVSGENDYYPLFIAWHEVQEYRMAYDEFNLNSEEKRLKELYGLDNEQLAWRRWQIANNLNGDEKLFKQEYPSNPEEAFLTTGDCVFNQEIVMKRIEEVKEPIMRGEFVYTFKASNIVLERQINNDSIKFVERKDGAVKIWKMPEKGQFYVIGGDTAGEGSDSFENQVLHLKTGEQVASMTHKNDEDFYVNQTYCLGKYYNWAKLAPENNFSTYPTKQLQKYEYPNLYMRQMEDSSTNTPRMQFGVKTTSVTRPLFISILKSVVNNEIGLINDKETLKQMLVFVKGKDSRGEAQGGQHDDKVMALAIAFYVRQQVLV